jgi:hypothetical protein
MLSQCWLRSGKAVDLGVYLVLRYLMPRVGDFMWISRLRTTSLMSSSRDCQSDAVLPIGATGMAQGNDSGHINWWVDLMIAIARGISECDRDLRSDQIS